ncbi:MAG TPA: hypothetical protein VNZ53_22105 [Steroidobacteraceae bacterium]|nr:hypothetical protein [Steroidobacteraceae bacterium]
MARRAEAAEGRDLNRGVAVTRVRPTDLGRSLTTAPYLQLSKNAVHVILYRRMLDPQEARYLFVR